MNAHEIAERADATFLFWGYRRGRVLGDDGLTPNVEYNQGYYPGSYLSGSEDRGDWREIVALSDCVVYRSGDAIIKIIRR